MAKKGLNIYRRKDGRWEGRVRIRRSRDGKAGYRSVYGRSYKEAREKVMALVKELAREEIGQKGSVKEQGTDGCGLTVGEIVDRWMEDKKGDWKESTYA